MRLNDGLLSCVQFCITVRGKSHESVSSSSSYIAEKTTSLDLGGCQTRRIMLNSKTAEKVIILSQKDMAIYRY